MFHQEALEYNTLLELYRLGAQLIDFRKICFWELIWNLIDMHCHDLKMILSNWRKLISDQFYCMRILKIKNIVTKTAEIQVKLFMGIKNQKPCRRKLR
jgi:hypothetical protein